MFAKNIDLEVHKLKYWKLLICDSNLKDLKDYNSFATEKMHFEKENVKYNKEAQIRCSGDSNFIVYKVLQDEFLHTFGNKKNEIGLNMSLLKRGVVKAFLKSSASLNNNEKNDPLKEISIFKLHFLNFKENINNLIKLEQNFAEKSNNFIEENKENINFLEIQKIFNTDCKDLEPTKYNNLYDDLIKEALNLCNSMIQDKEQLSKAFYEFDPYNFFSHRSKSNEERRNILILLNHDFLIQLDLSSKIKNQSDFQSYVLFKMHSNYMNLVSKFKHNNIISENDKAKILEKFSFGCDNFEENETGELKKNFLEFCAVHLNLYNTLLNLGNKLLLKIINEINSIIYSQKEIEKINILMNFIIDNESIILTQLDTLDLNEQQLKEKNSVLNQIENKKYSLTDDEKMEALIYNCRIPIFNYQESQLDNLSLRNKISKNNNTENYCNYLVDKMIQLKFLPAKMIRSLGHGFITHIFKNRNY